MPENKGTPPLLFFWRDTASKICRKTVELVLLRPVLKPALYILTSNCSIGSLSIDVACVFFLFLLDFFGAIADVHFISIKVI